LIDGKAKKSRSLAAFGSVNWMPTNDPRTYMPVFLLARLVPPSCHVRPRNPGWYCGISSRQVLKTDLTRALSHDSLPAMSRTWKS
jgi:hypothetical protein